MKSKDKDQKRKKIGSLGEEIACRFLMKHGYTIVSRNFRQKCGEIDIIAKKQAKLHFIEVKTVSRENTNNVIHETSHRAEDNMHHFKLQRIQKTIQIFLMKNNVSHETPFQIDGVTVILVPQERKALVRLIENINI